MKTKRIIITLLLVTALVLTFTACGTQKDEDNNSPGKTEAKDSSNDEKESNDGEAKEENDETYKLALVMKNRYNPYYIAMESGATAAAKNLGVELDVLATEKDADLQKQIQLCEDLLAKDYDALLVCPISSEAIVPFIKKCNDENMPFINVDTQAKQDLMDEMGAEYVCFVGSDEYKAGQVVAEAIIKDVGTEGNIAMLEGTPGAETADSRKSGFEDVIKEKSNLKIVASQTANWQRDKGYNVFQNMLQAHPDIKALFAANDLMALGAIEAIENAGMTGEIVVYSVDFIDDAKKALKDGTLKGSVYQAPDGMGRIAVEKAVAYLNGEEVKKDYRTEAQMMYKEDVQ